nr:hypothetical protein CFP56_39985 [Quercus suber]
MQVLSMKTKTEENVLNGGVLSVEFAKEIGIEDHGIVRREMVALVTKKADPDLGSKDNTSLRVENRGTGFATKRSVGERGDVRINDFELLANEMTLLIANKNVDFGLLNYCFEF